MLTRWVRIWEKLRAYSKSHNASVFDVLLRGIYLYVYKNVNLDDQMFNQSLDPNMPLDQARCYVGNKTFALFQRELNSHHTQCVADKSLFAQLAKGLDFPHPDTFLFFEHNPNCTVSHGLTRDNEVLSTKSQWLQYLEKNLPERFIIKSSFGLGGQNIEAFQRSKNGTYRGSTYQHTIEHIYRKVVEEKTFGKCIFQRYLDCHPDIVELTGSTAIQTVRLVTVKNDIGEISLYCGFLKVVGQPGTMIDNFKGGRGGNMMANLDLETGAICEATGYDRSSYTHVYSSHHPVTNRKLIGFEVPYWKEIVECSSALHTKMFGIRVIGWDIAITPTGPVILEGNCENGDMSPKRPWMTTADLEHLKSLLFTHKKHRIPSHGGFVAQGSSAFETH